jgi:quercetin dioxygenase-like cupin family protein
LRKLHLRDLADHPHSAGPVTAGAVPGFVAERGGVSRYEVGQRTHPEGYHIHEVPETFLILQGAGVIEIDGAPTPFQTGDVFVVEPGEDHHLVSAGELPLVSMWLHLRPAEASVAGPTERATVAVTEEVVEGAVGKVAEGVVEGVVETAG